MTLYGKGIAKGMWVTFRRFVTALTEDARYAGKRYLTGGAELSGELLLERQGPGARGAFTVQYPDEKLPVPENFRFIPFLVYDAETGDHRCTSCGICAKVCPPQCIWIVRGTDPETGRPKPEPEEFYIDATICMSCGSCAEFCPFDAIKMNHDYEVAVYDRAEMLYDIDKLNHPTTYHAEIHPTGWAAEEAARAEKEAKKKAKNQAN
jgi:NADH-quinone oxidoreductase subunit I